MDLKYFCDELCEELDGAKCYILKAIEVKPMNADWSKTFAQMSEDERSHAEHLYTMFNQYTSKLMAAYNETPEFIQKKVEHMQKKYTECMDNYLMYYNAYTKI